MSKKCKPLKRKLKLLLILYEYLWAALDCIPSWNYCSESINYMVWIIYIQKKNISNVLHFSSPVKFVLTLHLSHSFLTCFLSAYQINLLLRLTLTFVKFCVMPLSPYMVNLDLKPIFKYYKTEFFKANQKKGV